VGNPWVEKLSSWKVVDLGYQIFIPSYKAFCEIAKPRDNEAPNGR
jgi:hypothetical protein